MVEGKRFIGQVKKPLAFAIVHKSFYIKWNLGFPLSKTTPIFATNRYIVV
jgi:hypothetical protein